jgi:tetratricopeptide (TPR) repeat protein
MPQVLRKFAGVWTGLPLAIELAAARCKVLSPQAILTRLTGAMGGALGLLAGDIQDIPARQQTIRQTIEWSYNLLNKREQILFRRLGFFAGGCTLEAVEVILNKLKTDFQSNQRGISFGSALDSVLALIDQSLVRQEEGLDGEPRFFISETLREYAIECLTAANELDLMRLQHADLFLDLVERIEPNLRGAKQELGLQKLDGDYPNIRTALSWCAETDLEKALRFVSVLWEYWLTRGYLSEGRAWLMDILKKTEKGAMPPKKRAQALNGAGLLISVQGDQELAIHYLEESLQLFQDLGDQLGEAWVLNHLGQAMNLSGQLESAGNYFESSLMIFRRLGEKWHSAWVLINLGEVSLYRKEIDRATRLLTEARDLFLVLQDKRGTAAARDRLGRLALLTQQPDLAKVLLTESLQLFNEIGDREGCSWALHHLGRIAYEAGDKTQAIHYLIDSLQLFDKLNDHWGFAWSLVRLALVVSDINEPEHAAILFGAADTIMKGFTDRMLDSDHEFIHQTFLEERKKSNGNSWTRGQLMSSEKTLSWILEQSFY